MQSRLLGCPYVLEFTAKELLSLDYYSNLVGQFSLSNVWVQMEPWHAEFGIFESWLITVIFRVLFYVSKSSVEHVAMQFIDL